MHRLWRIVCAGAVMSCLGGGSYAQDLDALLNQAADLKAQNKWDDCIATLQSAVDRAAEDPAKAALAQCRIGEAYVAMAKPKKAEAALRKVVSDFPAQTEPVNWSRVALIDALTFQGKRDDALAAFDELKTAYDAGGALPLQYAWGAVKAAGLHSAAGNTAEALDLLEQVESLPITDTGPKVSAALSRSEMLIKAKDFIAAIEPLQALVETTQESQPTEANWAKLRLAEALYQSNRYQESIDVANSLLTQEDDTGIRPDQIVHAYLWKVRNHLVLANFPEATHAATLARSVKNVPANLNCEALFSLGLAYSQWAGTPQPDMSQAQRNDLQSQALNAYMAALEFAQEAKLAESTQDTARSKVSAILHASGEKDLSISILRMGVEDPANLDGSDRALVQQIATLLAPNDAKDWYEYIIDPIGRSDPTSPIVTSALSSTPPPPQIGTTTGSRFDCYLALAKLASPDPASYEQALTRFQHAAEVATSSVQLGTALRGLAELHSATARSSTLPEAASTQKELARRAATEAIAAWMQVVTDGTPAQAHGAIDNIVDCYAIGDLTGLPEALVALEQNIDPVTAPSKHLFAQYALLRVDGKRGLSKLVLAERAEKAYRNYKDYSRSDIRELASIMLLWAVHYQLSAGNAVRVSALLDELVLASGERFRDHIATYRGYWPTNSIPVPRLSTEHSTQ